MTTTTTTSAPITEETPSSPKQFLKRMSTREMEHQSRIATQKAMFDLMKNTASSETFVSEEDAELKKPDDFDMRNYFREYCSDGLSDEQKQLKVFYLLHQNSIYSEHCRRLKLDIEDLKESIKEQKENEEYQEEETERYIEELDLKDIKIGELNLRITKLRQKCISKNNSLFWWRVAFFSNLVAMGSWYVYQNCEPNVIQKLFEFIW